jgi:ubiquinone/menaquinone biosynthesis C-methylase UbiE
MNYEEIFDLRGKSYDNAMKSNIHARHQEFETIINAISLQPGQTIADVPAGGGYLKEFLPKDVSWVGFEPCAEFNGHQLQNNDEHNIFNLPWARESIDAITSIAGVHHTDDKLKLWAEMHRVLKPNGQIAILDVEKDSTVAHFLDDFIGLYNTTGHDGIYLSNTSALDFTDCGFKNVVAQTKDIYWQFSTIKDMCLFCKQLFGLQDISLGEIEKNINDFLNIKQELNNIQIHWPMLLIHGFK